MRSIPKIFITFFSLLFLISCDKSEPALNSSAVPKGTDVKYEALNDGSEKITVQYTDGQNNWISNKVNTGWSYSFTTTKDVPFLQFIVDNYRSMVTGRLYINGVLKKEGKDGTRAELRYP